MQHTDLSKVIAAIETAFAGAEQRGYERGLAEARRRVQDVLTSDSARAVATSEPAQQHMPTPATDADEAERSRKRAPKGLVRTVITRELRNASAGLTPAEIQGRAQTNDERMIVASSYRSELRVGRDAGRYRDQGGKWFLAETARVEDSPSTLAFDKAERG